VWREENVLQDLKGIMIKLKTVMIRLQGWSNRKFSNVIQELDRNRKKLEQLLLTDGDSEEIREVSDYIDELLYREEMLWLQWSEYHG
jgi:predicted CopG family antitoxin